MALVDPADDASDEVERFRDLVGRQLGLFFEDAKLGFLADVLRHRLAANAVDASAYLARLERAPSAEEHGALAQELTVPETYFFRNIEQFHALAQLALPERFRAQQARRCLRLLSAGCASGDEAYSLAVIARENVPDASWDLSVRAVDLNPTMLERARRARFTDWALRETPAEQRNWFRQEGREFVLDDAVRGAVRFEQRNLAQDDPELWQAEFYDVIFCRNVIMYFTPENARALIGRITRSLAPGGYLFLGYAETLRGLSQDFHLRHAHGAFCYQRKGAIEAAAAHWTECGSTPRHLASELPAVVTGAASWIDVIHRAAARIHALAEAPGAVGVAALRAKPDLGSAFELLSRERFQAALEVVRGLPSESASDPDVLMLEAVLLTHSGQLANAKAACARLLAMDELSAGAHYVLALCCEAEGDRREAAEHDQVAIYLDPAFAMPRLHLGLLARKDGDRDTARRELRQALHLLQREEAARLLLFGGGFGRDALIALCASELQAHGDAR
ncbi:MAG: CheR family methyltransferase [Candidatus Binatia bacterium]